VRIARAERGGRLPAIWGEGRHGHTPLQDVVQLLVVVVAVQPDRGPRLQPRVDHELERRGEQPLTVAVTFAEHPGGEVAAVAGARPGLAWIGVRGVVDDMGHTLAALFDRPTRIAAVIGPSGGVEGLTRRPLVLLHGSTVHA